MTHEDIRNYGPLTFGLAISQARLAKGWSLQQLASLILKRKDSRPISTTYLFAIEMGHSRPRCTHMIRQFAQELDLDDDFLSLLAGKIPEDIRKYDMSPAQAANAFRAFRAAMSLESEA